MTWNGAAEIVYAVDPATGVGAPQGALAGLHWTTQYSPMAYDASAGVAYAMGMPATGNQSYCYALDLATGESSSAPTAYPYVLARP